MKEIFLIDVRDVLDEVVGYTTPLKVVESARTVGEAVDLWIEHDFKDKKDAIEIYVEMKKEEYKCIKKTIIQRIGPEKRPIYRDYQPRRDYHESDYSTDNMYE